MSEWRPSRERPMPSGAVKLSIKPVFVGWITLLTQLPLQLFFTVWSGGFFGGIGTTIGIFPQDSRMPFIVCGAIAFFGVPIVAYVGKKLNYSRTEYRFYADRLEFDEGFFSINRKIVKFRDVKETTLRRGILQRTCGLGSIYLATLATGSNGNANPFIALGFGNVSASGVIVRDINDPDDTFEKVRQLVDAQNI
jgi:membrane protein YdbS with pleckstrin-like domain